MVEKTVKQLRDIAAHQVHYFLERMQWAKDDLQIEAELYDIYRTAEKFSGQMHIINANKREVRP
jgi:hypothetical protein